MNVSIIAVIISGKCIGDGGDNFGKGFHQCGDKIDSRLNDKRDVIQKCRCDTFDNFRHNTADSSDNFR